MIKPDPKWQGIMVLFSIAAFTLMLMGTNAVLDYHTHGEWSNPGKKFSEYYMQKLHELNHYTPDSVRFTRDNKTKVVTDRTDIARFIDLLQSGKEMIHNHTHPEHEMQFTFEGQDTVYTLSPDSSTPDKYWLEVVPEKDSPYTITSPEIRMFQSRDMSEWLERYGLLSARD